MKKLFLQNAKMIENNDNHAGLTCKLIVFECQLAKSREKNRKPMQNACAWDGKNAHKKPDGANHPVFLFEIGKIVPLRIPAIAEAGTDRLRRLRIPARV